MRDRVLAACLLLADRRTRTVRLLRTTDPVTMVGLSLQILRCCPPVETPQNGW